MGAGLAGLSAAATLTRDGAAVAVLEARDRVGGRLLSISDGDEAVDLGTTWFWPDEPLVRGLADDLGIATFATNGDALSNAIASRSSASMATRSTGLLRASPRVRRRSPYAWPTGSLLASCVSEAR